MINLISMTMGHFTPIPIQEFKVWWMTPMGVLANLSDAIAVCKAADLEPNLCVKGISVAIGVDGTWEVCP